MKQASRFIATGAVLLLLINGVFSPIGAQHPWTAVGSTGVTDGFDIGELFFNPAMSGTASVSPNATLPAQVTIRYNVVAVSDLVKNPDTGFNFTARFRDNGPQARVILRLRSVNIGTGFVQLIQTLDSNNYPPSASFQTRTVFFCSGNDFDFTQSAYFVEAELLRNTGAAQPALAAISIGLGPIHGACPP